MSGEKGDANRQIKQMVNFILQEAHEKVNEIRIRVSRIVNGIFIFQQKNIFTSCFNLIP